MQKNLFVAERKIEMPFQRLHDITLSCQALTLSRINREGGIRTLFGNLFHRESCLLERLVNLIAHLEMVERNARTYHRLQLLRVGMIGKRHLLNGFMHDASQRTTPAGMDGSHSMMLLIIKKHRDAIGSRNTDTYTFLVSHHGIYTFEHHLADILRHGEKLTGNIAHLYSMHLMGHDDMVGSDTELSSKTLAVFSHMFCIVTAKLIDIKFAIVALAYSSLAGSRESHDTRSYLIFFDHNIYSYSKSSRSSTSSISSSSIYSTTSSPSAASSCWKRDISLSR